MKKTVRGCWAVGTLLLCILLRPGNALSEENPSPFVSRLDEAKGLLNSEDPYQRQLGFMRLEALRDPDTVEVIKPYLEDKDPLTRSYSLRALAAIQGAAAVPTLLEALKSDRHPNVRRAALLGLEPFEKTSAEILPAFLKALRDRHPEVRMTAIDIVSRIDEPRAREAIRERRKRERHRDVRRVLEMVIKRTGA